LGRRGKNEKKKKRKKAEKKPEFPKSSKEDEKLAPVRLRKRSGKRKGSVIVDHRTKIGSSSI